MISRSRNLNGQLGIIPDWQFDLSNPNNPALNRYMVMPAGMTQMTVQPNWGLSDNQVATVVGVDPAAGAPAIDAPVAAMNNLFSSWGFRNRKLLVIGGAAVVGLLALGAVAAIVR